MQRLGVVLDSTAGGPLERERDLEQIALNILGRRMGEFIGKCIPDQPAMLLADDGQERLRMAEVPQLRLCCRGRATRQ